MEDGFWADINLFFLISSVFLSAIISGLIIYLRSRKNKLSKRKLLYQFLFANSFIYLLCMGAELFSNLQDDNSAYHRVDFVTPINEDYLTKKENQVMYTCHAAMGIHQFYTCKPYFFFLHYYRKHFTDFNTVEEETLARKSRMERANERYQLEGKKKFEQCQANPDFRKEYCQEGISRYWIPAFNDDEVYPVLVDILNNVEANFTSLTPREVYILVDEIEVGIFLVKMSYKGSLYHIKIYKKLILMMFKNCFKDHYFNSCSYLHNYIDFGYQNESVPIRSIIIYSMLLKYSGHDLGWDLGSRFKELESKYQVNTFETFYKLVLDHYPVELTSIGIENVDMEFWKTIYEEKSF